MAEEFGIWSSVKDKLSGVHGIVIARTVHAFGPTELGIQREGLDAEGKMWELVWLPEARCEPYAD